MPGGMNNFALANAVVDIIKNNCPDVVSIDMSYNDISTLKRWSRLGNVARFVVNLSLEGNKILVSGNGGRPGATSFLTLYFLVQDLQELRHLRPLRKVANLVLTNNPGVALLNSRADYEQCVALAVWPF